MSPGKIVMVVIYAVLAVCALTQGDSALGVWSLRILILLAVVHSIEVAVFFKACRAAGGSLAGHLVSVFFFGVLHMQEIRTAQRGGA